MTVMYLSDFLDFLSKKLGIYCVLCDLKRTAFAFLTTIVIRKIDPSIVVISVYFATLCLIQGLFHVFHRITRLSMK